MTGVFARLWWWSFRGRIRRRLRLARQPKYAVGLVFGIAYFGWLFLRPLLQSRQGRGLESLPDYGWTGLHVALALLAAFYVCGSWLFSPARDALKLRSSEMHFLLPGPMSRRTVVAYAVLKRVPAFALTAILLGFFLSSGSAGARVGHAAFIFVLFSLWDLHGKARNQIRSWAENRPIARGVVVAARAGLGIYGGFLALQVISLVRRAIPILGPLDEDDFGVFAANFIEQLHGTPLLDALTPFLWITGGRFDPIPARASISWGIDAALAFALFAVILWIPVRFERSAEGTKAEQRVAERRRNQSEKKRARHPFRLQENAPPELALFWKNLIVLTRTPLHRLSAAWLAGLAVLVAAGGFLGIPHAVAGVAAMALAVLSSWVPIFTGMLWANGFRRDLPYLESLRTWPVAGHRMVFGQSLAGAAQAVALLLAAASLILGVDAAARLAADWGTGGHPHGVVPEHVPGALHVPSALVLPLVLTGVLFLMAGVSFVSSALECVTTLLFPGWLMITDRQQGDPAAFGQRILFALGFFFAVIAGLLPAALLVGVVVAAQLAAGQPVVGWELPLLGLLAAAPVMLEGYVLVRIGGRLWTRMDPAQEILEGFR